LGTIAFIVGLIFIVAALVLVIAVVDFEADLWPTLILTFFVALAIELLVGPDVRRLATGENRPAPPRDALP
jgi:hypothetical protein